MRNFTCMSSHPCSQARPSNKLRAAAERRCSSTHFSLQLDRPLHVETGILACGTCFQMMVPLVTVRCVFCRRRSGRVVVGPRICRVWLLNQNCFCTAAPATHYLQHHFALFNGTSGYILKPIEMRRFAGDSGGIRPHSPTHLRSWSRLRLKFVWFRLT